MLDFLIRNARVIDGTGGASRYCDVLVDGDEIIAVLPAGEVAASGAHEVLDADGLVLAPGFIDVHTHDDALLLQSVIRGNAHPKLSQGVTTVITGNCGVSLAPLQSRDVPAPLDILGADAFRFASFADYLSELAAHQPACNAASLIGHTTLRIKHVADTSKEATLQQC